MPLLCTPTDLAIMRQRLFDLETPIVLSAAEYALYWQYVDNIWSISERSKDGKKHYYRCRLSRSTKPAPKKEGVKHRNRTVRQSQCKVNAVVIFDPEGNAHFRRVGEHVHGHTLQISDKFKKNSYLRNLGREEGSKGYAAPAIVAALKGAGRSGDAQALLEAAGGAHLDTQFIYNQAAEWRKKNPKDPNSPTPKPATPKKGKKAQMAPVASMAPPEQIVPSAQITSIASIAPMVPMIQMAPMAPIV